MAEISFATPISELVMAIQAGNVTSHNLVAASLAKIELASDYHAILEVNPAALEQALVMDARIKAGEKLPLAGIPFIAKDNFLTSNTHTTASSNILKSFRAPYQAIAIKRLEAAGAIMVAKANMDAFGHGASTENSDFAVTKNPFDEERVAGGSSGGSAVAVALDLAPFALGTDTGGSSRQPASFAGVTGFKPTYGLIPRTGVVAMASSTDTIGILSHSTSDTALVLDVLAGIDPSDSTSIERDPKPYALSDKVRKLTSTRFGLVKEYLEAGVDPEVKKVILAAVDQIKANGGEVHEISLPATKLALAAYYILVPGEISSNLARYDGVRYGHSSTGATNLEETYLLSRNEGFGDEAKRRILIGTYVLSSGYYDAYYKRAQKVRTQLIGEFNDAFKKFDVLIGPTTPTTAFRVGEKAHDPVAMYLADIMTVAANLVGIPAISIPVAMASGLPVGLQLMTAQNKERELLSIASGVECVIGAWKSR